MPRHEHAAQVGPASALVQTRNPSRYARTSQLHCTTTRAPSDLRLLCDNKMLINEDLITSLEETQ